VWPPLQTVCDNIEQCTEYSGPSLLKLCEEVISCSEATLRWAQLYGQATVGKVLPLNKTRYSIQDDRANCIKQHFTSVGIPLARAISGTGCESA
jgi:hypothetical protein